MLKAARTYIYKRRYAHSKPWSWNCFNLNINCASGEHKYWEVVRAEAQAHYNECHKEVSRAAGPSI